MIAVAKNVITQNDIKTIMNINPEETEPYNGFVTDGRYLYYVDGYNSPKEIRGMTLEEQFFNHSELAKAMNMTKSQLFNYMLKKNKEVDYENCKETECKTKKGVNEWWKKHHNDYTIFKVYDEYYGLDELIATL